MNYVQDRAGKRLFRPRSFGIPQEGDWFIPQGEHALVAIQWTDKDQKMTTHGNMRVLLEEVPSSIKIAYNVQSPNMVDYETPRPLDEVGRRLFTMNAQTVTVTRVTRLIADGPFSQHVDVKP